MLATRLSSADTLNESVLYRKQTSHPRLYSWFGPYLIQAETEV